jgi:hypothetical protein
MSLSDRWSFFRTVKSKEEEGRQEKEDRQEKESQQCNDDEVVVSMMHTVQEQQQQQQQQQDEPSENNVNSDACTNVDADTNTEAMINSYLHQTCFSEARWQNEEGQEQEQQQEHTNPESRNSHYKGVFTELMPTMPVLFIEENVPSAEFKKVRKNVTDWRAYVYYDSYKNVYVLNGTRRRSDESGMERKYPDIHMSFRSKSALAFFLRRSMCSWRHNLSVTMYSMYRSVIHLSTPGATPSFHSIHKCRSKFRSELFGYDDCRMSMKEFESYLKMLKEIGDDGLLFRPMKC